MITSRVSELKGKPVHAIRSYAEVVEFLNALPAYEYGEKSLQRAQELDRLMGNPSKQLDTILVGGTNGKSLTMHFASKLFKEEKYTVGKAFSTHFMRYNERLVIDSDQVSDGMFADYLNQVITMVEMNNLAPTAYECMLVASLLYFSEKKVDIALIEVASGGKFDAAAICNPKVVAITRVTDDITGDLDTTAFEMMGCARAKSWCISGEQSKIRLQKMKTWAAEHGVVWSMPIRKLSSLPYVYEQLYGRVASLGERIVQIYVEDIKQKFSPFLKGNLLATEKGRRGRPTLEAKRLAELNPIKTLKNFWKDEFSLLPGRFELLDKENPTILLDNAHNLDAFNNVFLGARLLHYQQALKGFALIIGVSDKVNIEEFSKSLRYLLKKVQGQVFFVPLPNESYHDPEELALLARSINVKGQACESFEQAFRYAKALVNEPGGLIAITGSHEMVRAYKQLKD